MVGVGILPRLADRLCHTAHLGLSRPVELGQLAVRLHRVQVAIPGHMQPVDASDVFAPADDLADEALGAVERHVAGAVGGLRGGDHGAGTQQATIQRGRDERVEQYRRIGTHSVLPVPELGQPAFDEVGQRLLRLRRRDGKREALNATEMLAEPFGHESHDVLGDGVRGEIRRRRHFVLGRELLPVLRVEVPLFALGLGAVHKHVILAAHVAIEELHPQRAAALGPAAKLADGAEKAVVVADVHLAPRRFVPTPHVFQHAPFAGFGDDDSCCVMAGDSAQDLAPKGGGVGGIVETDVIDGDASGGKLGGEVAHCREDQHDFLGVMADVCAFAHDLHHQHHIAGSRVRQCREVVGELVAKDNAENCHEAQIVATDRLSPLTTPPPFPHRMLFQDPVRGCFRVPARLRGCIRWRGVVRLPVRAC